MYKIFNDLFERNEDIIKEFSAPEDALTGAYVLLARYQYEDYSGNAIVIFEKGGKLYEVNGGHCSCYGLEGQWSPEETSWEALAMRDDQEIKDMITSQRFMLAVRKALA